MGYYFNNDGYNNNRKQKESEDRQYRLSRTYNTIFRKIEKMQNAKEIVQLRNQINIYSKEQGVSIVDVDRLNKKLREKIKDVQDETQSKIDRLNTQISELKADHLQESSDTIKDLQTKSDNELLQLLMRLRKDDVYNKRFLGSYLTNASREQAIAVCKLSQMEQFKNTLSEKQRQVALEKSQSQAIRIYEQHKEERIAELNKELSPLYMQAFHIRNVQKQISNSEKQYYWNAEEG